MKYIKTYWHNLEGISRENFYLEIKTQPLYLFGLSSLLLTEHHEVELYTDAEGEKIIGQFNIPFSRVHVLDKVSARYKSLNDLHVLSLQTEPVVLIDDNLLVMGQVDVRVPPSSVTVLGIELNSGKLVKSLMKVYRITETIPQLDDTLWLKNKLAYKDMSLIAIQHGKYIKDYFTAANKFVAEHFASLSKIEYAVVENFLRRYWLYSYLESNGVHFCDYFDDALNVIPAINVFAFSNKNVFQNVLRLLDHCFFDEQFSIHLFRFFQLRYGEHFAQIENYCNTELKNSKPDAYRRTKQALQRLVPDPQAQTQRSNLLRSKRAIGNLIAMCEKNGLSSRETHLLKDVFSFESYVDKICKYFSKEISLIHSQELEGFKNILKSWDLDESSFENLSMKINPYVFFKESEWKWNTHWIKGVEKNKVAELKVIYNVPLDPAYFITAFLFDPTTSSVFEFSIDRISAEIVDHFSTENTISSFFLYMQSQESTGKDMNSMRQVYYTRIRDLLLINILCIYER